MTFTWLATSELATTDACLSGLAPSTTTATTNAEHSASAAVRSHDVKAEVMWRGFNLSHQRQQINDALTLANYLALCKLKAIG